MNDSTTIIVLLVIILILLIVFIIVTVFFAFVPISRMENTVIKTAEDIEKTITIIDTTSANVNNLVQTITKEMTNINADITAVEEGLCKSPFASFFPFCKK